MFLAALFTVARAWNQPKRPSKEEWIEKTWYLQTMDYHLAVKGNKIMSFAATCMDLEVFIQSGVSLIEKNKYHMRSLICGV